MAVPDLKTASPTTSTITALSDVSLPRITIEFCTQCKWNLRAAYYAQELLQTFGTSLGEVSLMPATGGTFVITLYARHENSETNEEKSETFKVVRNVVWNRKVDSGFPETKELKNRVRNIIEPGRHLGHTDRALKREKEHAKGKETESFEEQDQKENCRECS